MKFVMLVDSGSTCYEEMVEKAVEYKPYLISTKNCSEENEYRFLRNGIDKFLQSDMDVMLVNFSGRESITKDIGDECSEMVLTISENKRSKYYTECPIRTFVELTSILI